MKTQDSYSSAMQSRTPEVRLALGPPGLTQLAERELEMVAAGRSPHGRPSGSGPYRPKPSPL